MLLYKTFESLSWVNNKIDSPLKLNVKLNWCWISFCNAERYSSSSLSSLRSNFCSARNRLYTNLESQWLELPGLRIVVLKTCTLICSYSISLSSQSSWKRRIKTLTRAPVGVTFLLNFLCLSEEFNTLEKNRWTVINGDIERRYKRC